MYLKMTKLVCCFVELEMVGDVVVFVLATLYFCCFLVVFFVCTMECCGLCKFFIKKQTKNTVFLCVFDGI